MSRHIYKASSQEDLDQAIADGIVESPYVAYISDGNTVKMIIPSGSEPASIDYSSEATPLTVIITGSDRLDSTTFWIEAGMTPYAEEQFGEGCYFAVSTVSDSEDWAIREQYVDPETGDVDDWDSYYDDLNALIVTNASGHYNATSEDPASITLTVPDDEGGNVYAVLYDANDEVVDHPRLDGWSGPEPEEEGEPEE